MLRFVLKQGLQSSKVRAVEALAHLSVSTGMTFRDGMSAVLNESDLNRAERAEMTIVFAEYVAQRLGSSESVMDRAPNPLEAKLLRSAWPPRVNTNGLNDLAAYLLRYRSALRYGGFLTTGCLADMVGTARLEKKLLRQFESMVNNPGAFHEIANVQPEAAGRAMLQKMDRVLTQSLKDMADGSN